MSVPAPPVKVIVPVNGSNELAPLPNVKTSFPALPSIAVIVLNAIPLIVPLRFPVTLTVSTAPLSPSNAAPSNDVIFVKVPPLNCNVPPDIVV